MKHLNIRWRLTLWYGGVLAVVLVVFGASVYLMMRQVLRARLDAAIGQELEEVAEVVEEAESQRELQQELGRRFANHEGYGFQVARMGGGIVFRSDLLKAQGLPVPAIPKSLERLDFERVPLRTETAALGRWRLTGQLVPGPEGALVVQAAGSLAPDERELGELLLVLLLAGPLALAAAIGGGYMLARKALQPVDRMRAAAAEITAARLNRRIEVAHHDDELARLAQTLNGMIARLEQSFAEVRRFTADAAHELRTPLAVLRSEAEVTLRAPRTAEEYRTAIADMLEEIERLSRIAEQLLFLCREDGGIGPRIRVPMRLDEVVEDVAGHMRVLAEAKDVSLVQNPLPAVEVVGDAEQLRRVFLNLLDNAVKFTPGGGRITVRGEALEEQARITVSDTGTGIPPEHLPHIFERFYRADPARGRRVDGTGLGLAICRSIIESHGGWLQIESTAGRGTDVCVTLPLQPPETSADRAPKRAGRRNPAEVAAGEKPGTPRS